MELKKTRLLLGGLTVVALGTASLTLPSGASETPTGAATGTLRSQSVPSSNDMFDTAEADEFLDEEFVLSADCDAIFEALDGLDGLDWTPSEADIEAMNAETDDLVDFLAENGIEIDVETDEFGVRFPIEDDIDEDTMELIDEFYASHGFDLDDETFFDDLDELDWTPSEADIEAMNAETDDLVDFLAENGIEIDVETDEFGVRFPIEDDIDEDTMELIDEFYASYEFDLDDEAFFDDLDELGISIEELEDCEQELFEYEEALMMEDGHYFDDDYCDDEDEDDDDDDIESSDDPAENDPTD